MAIGTDASVLFFGTQDTITSSAGSIANNAYGYAGADWTNDDDAPYCSFVLRCNFSTTMPTVGSLDLYDRLMNVQGTNDQEPPDANHRGIYLGSFPIDFGQAAGVTFTTVLHNIELPVVNTSQVHGFYLHNNGTGQSVAASWLLYGTPITIGPHA